MKFKVQTKALVAALAKVQTVTENNIVTISTSKKGLRVAAQGKTTMLAMKVPADVEKAGTMSIESYMFSQSIKNRAEVTVSMSGSQAIVTGKSMSLKLVTVPAEDIPVLDRKNGSVIDAEGHAVFAKCVGLAGITNVHDENPMGLRVTIGKKGITVIAADQHHMAMARSTKGKSSKELQFTLDLKSFTTIAQLAGKEPYSMAFTESEVLAWGANFELRIPTVADDSTGPSTEAVTSMMKAVIDNKPQVSATVSLKEWGDALDTMNGIFEGGANVSLNTGDKGLEVEFATSYGESKVTVKTDKPKGKFKHNVDLPLTIDTFAHIRDKTLDLAVYNDRILYARERIDDMDCLYLMTMVVAKEKEKTKSRGKSKSSE